MKTVKLLLGVVLCAGIAAVITGCGVFYARQNTAYREHKIEARTLQRVSAFTEIESRADLKLCAHRGLSATAPENTLEAIRQAGEAGFSLVFLDVMLTKDGVPILLYDRTIDRMTTGTGRVSAQTAESLHTFPLDNGAHVEEYGEMYIPTLEEALKICVQYAVTPVLHIRTMPTAKAVTAVVGKQSLSWIVAGIDRELLRYCMEETGCGGWYMVEGITQAAVDFAKENRCVLAFDGDKKTNADVILRKALSQVELCAYCVNRRESVGRFADLGVRIMVTDCIIPAKRK